MRKKWHKIQKLGRKRYLRVTQRYEGLARIHIGEAKVNQAVVVFEAVANGRVVGLAVKKVIPLYA